MVEKKELHLFFLSIFSLCTVGLIMVFSSSYMHAKEYYHSSLYFFLKQFAFLGLGISIAFCCYHIKPEFWKKWSIPIHILFSSFLFLTLFKGVGLEVNGSTRWLKIMGFKFQPAEFIKYSLLYFVVFNFKNIEVKNYKYLLFLAFFTFAPLITLLLQPDFGIFTICILCLTVLMYLSPVGTRYFWRIIFIEGIILFSILVMAPYRVKRLLTFLDPWKDPQRGGFQIIQSYLAFANGSFTGKGIGNSFEKLFYLPEAYNDFIFSVLGEELGFIGVLFTVALYLGFLILGIKAFKKINDEKFKLFAICIVFSITIQSVTNMCVVLGLLPTKGLNLPFISYGGSSLLANFLFLGIIFSCLNPKFQKN